MLYKAKRFAFLLACAALCVYLVTSSGLVQAKPRTLTKEFVAKVIHVDDGDTVVALRSDGEQVKVRLANIDAPEIQHGRCRQGQPFGQKSGEALASLVKGKTVQFSCATLDRYDRHVCDIGIDGTTASRELVRQGLAWANRSRPSYLRDRGVADAEREAQARRVGLWADNTAVKPWEWRHTVWKEGCKG